MLPALATVDSFDGCPRNSIHGGDVLLGITLLKKASYLDDLGVGKFRGFDSLSLWGESKHSRVRTILGRRNIFKVCEEVVSFYAVPVITIFAPWQRAYKAQKNEPVNVELSLDAILTKTNNRIAAYFSAARKTFTKGKWFPSFATVDTYVPHPSKIADLVEVFIVRNWLPNFFFGGIIRFRHLGSLDESKCLGTVGA